VVVVVVVLLLLLSLAQWHPDLTTSIEYRIPNVFMFYNDAGGVW
jgi:hypothetical protein